MVSMRRIRTVFTGVAGSPFYSNMFFTLVNGQETAAETAVYNFWAALQPGIEDRISVQVEREQQIVDDATGDVIDTVTTAGRNPLVGSDPGDPLPGLVQGLIRWRTGTFVNGRRIQGRTFIPGATEGSNQDGLPLGVYTARFTTAAAALIAASSSSGPLRIYSPTKLQSAAVISALPATQWSYLESRRP